MKFLILFSFSLILSSQSFAQSKAEGCIDQTLRAKFAIKMKGILSQLREESLDAKQKGLFQNDIDPEKICGMVSQEEKDQFDTDREGFKKVKKHLVKQFANKKKIPADVFVALDTDTTKTELTEAEVCEETSKILKKESGTDPCASEKYDIASSGQVDSLNGSFEDVCKKLLPVYRENFKRVQRCGLNQTESKAPKKALPKAEIEEIHSDDKENSKKYAKPSKPKASGSPSSGSGKTGSKASGQ